MAPHRKNRRPGGHPAKVAARRERDAQTAQERQNPARRTARALATEFARAAGPVEAEILASHVIRMAYPESIEIGDVPDDIEEEMISPLIAELGKLADGDALAALSALAAVSSTEIGVSANRLREQLLADGVMAPAWASELLVVEVTGAVELREPIYDDAFSAVLEVRYDSGQTSVVSVLIDNNLGGMAKDIIIGDTIDHIREIVARHPGEDDFTIDIVVADPGMVATNILDAIGLADCTLGDITSDSYAELRSLARHRAFCTSLSKPGSGLLEREVPEAAREQALADFMAADEASQLEDRETAEWLAELAIDFSADYTIGELMRWSPIKIEIFLVDWVPRKVMAEPDDLEVLPAVMAAMIRYTARRRKMPAAQLDECLNAIDLCTASMHERIESGGGGGAAHEMLTAAREAGVDLADEQQMATFIAGWNARSVIDE